MNFTERQGGLLRISAFVVLSVAVGLTAMYVSRRIANAQPEYRCSPATGEVCANDAFYQEYRHWKALQTEVANEQQSPAARQLQDKADLANGLATRLRSEFPKGMTWDEKKLVFIPAPTDPTAAATTIAPAPAK